MIASRTVTATALSRRAVSVHVNQRTYRLSLAARGCRAPQATALIASACACLTLNGLTWLIGASSP